MYHSNLEEILENTFGEYKSSNNSNELEFNCPVCDDGDKHNLAISMESHMYKCWKCEMSGIYIDKLINRFSKEKINWSVNKHLLVRRSKESIYNLPVIPKEYITFSDMDKNNPLHLEAYNYLLSRGVDNKMMNKFKLGFCLEGTYQKRIIIPSYNEYNELNYCDSRTYVNNSIAYLKQKNVSKDIICFENLVDFNTRIFIVEGVFDSFVIPNSTPLLGKVLQDKLFNKIIKYQTPISVILDVDAYKQAERYFIKLHNSGIDVKNHTLDTKDTSKINELYGRKGILEIINQH